MEFLKNMFQMFYDALVGSSEDNYLDIIPKPSLIDLSKGSIPEELLGDNIPNFGNQQEKMLRWSMSLYHNNANRIAWLNSIHTLRRTKVGWQLDHTESKKNPEDRNFDSVESNNLSGNYLKLCVK